MRSKRISVLLGSLVILAVAILWIARVFHMLPRSRERATPAIESMPVPSTKLAEEPAPLSSKPASKPASEPDAAVNPPATSSVREPTPAAVTPEPTLTLSPEHSSVSGRVVDMAGNPIVDVRVLAKFAIDIDARTLPLWKQRMPLDVADLTALGIDAPRASTTDTDGRFSFDDCAPGRFRLVLRSARMAPRDFDDLLLPAESRFVIPDIELEPGVVVSGLVLDPHERALPGARIARLDLFLDPTLPALSAAVAPLLAITNLQGRFQTIALVPGPSSLIVSAARDRDSRTADSPEQRVDIASARAGDVQEIRIQIPSPEWIGARVLARPADVTRIEVAAIHASATTSPLPASCRADYRLARTRSDGTCALDGLDPLSAYDLRTVSPTQSFDDLSPWSPPVLAVAGEPTQVALTYEPDCRIHFLVEDPKTRAPVTRYAAALIGATPRGLSANDDLRVETHAQGVTSISGIRPLESLRGESTRGASTARVALELLGDRFPKFRREEPLISGGDLDVGPIYVDLLPLVEVRVREKRGGSPISGAVVQAIERDEANADGERSAADAFVSTALTDALGSARVASSLARGVTIVARATGFAPARMHGSEIRPGDSSCTIDLVPGARIRARVIDALGAPVAGVRVEHVAGDWTPNDRGFDAEDDADFLDRSHVTNAAGACSFSDLALGRHTFRLTREHTLSDGEWEIVDLSAVGPSEIVLVTRGFGNVAGRVFDGTKPQAGVHVAACRAEYFRARTSFVEADAPLPPCVATTSDSRGRFALQNLEPGPYCFVFGIDGQRLRLVREVQVDGGDNNLYEDVALGAIDGVVEEADGTPASSAGVWVLTREQSNRLEISSRDLDAAREAVDLEGCLRGYPSDMDHPAVLVDAHGHFRLRGLAHNEAYTLFASDGAHGGGSTRLSAVRRAREEHSVAIRLEPRGLAQVVSNPVRWKLPLVLVAHRPNAPLRALRFRPGLDVTLPALEPGSWSIALFEERSDRRFYPTLDRREITITAGADETVDINLP